MTELIAMLAALAVRENNLDSPDVRSICNGVVVVSIMRTLYKD